MSEARQILVLAYRDHAEAMRVSAGLTIFGHTVELVFMDRMVEENAENMAQAELLELCEIEPVSMVEDPNLDHIDYPQLHVYLERAAHVINL